MKLAYATVYIIRFSGVLSVGPNAGRAFRYADSWAGHTYPSAQAAADAVKVLARKNPDASFCVVARSYSPKERGMVEAAYC